jgi:hypothetical protein
MELFSQLSAILKTALQIHSDPHLPVAHAETFFAKKRPNFSRNES